MPQASSTADPAGLRDGYGVARFRVDEGDWLGGRTVGALDLAAEGILVFGIECPGGHFVGVHAPDVQIQARDVLVVYDRSAQITALEQRRNDSLVGHAHEEAVMQRRDRESSERARVGR